MSKIPNIGVTPEELDAVATAVENTHLMQAEIESQIHLLLENFAADIFGSLKKNDGDLPLSIGVRITEGKQDLSITTRLSYSKEKVKAEVKKNISMNQLSLPVEND
jgi:hypothetical protein